VLRRLVHGAALSYTAGVVGYALLRPLVREREGWLELADDLEPWSYLPAPVLGLGGAILGCGTLATAGAALAATFGLRWGHRFLRRGPSRAKADADLVVMTYNTLAWQREGDDLADSIVKANPDIVGLQEIGTRAAEYLARTLADRYPHHHITNGARASGAALLSRYPIADAEAFRASAGGHWWQRMTIETPRGPITYVNVHTRIPYLRMWHASRRRLSFPLEYVTDRRRGEIDLLTDMLSRIDGPVIVAGDFNMTERCRDHRLLSTMLRDAFRDVGVGFGHSFPSRGSMPRLFPSPLPMLRLDYVWHSDHLAASWAYRGDAGRSDHHPIVTGLRWSESVEEIGGSVPLAASTV
jgi:vancomycin resistance protein VanJ